MARISEFSEETVPLYRGDVFRSHFRMTRPTLETLCQMLAPSEHIPKGNAFGRRPIEPQKQIAVAVWALANQESCLQISGLSLKVGRGRGTWDVGRGTRGRGDVGTWGRGDAGTRGRGDSRTQGREDFETRRRAGILGRDKQIAPNFWAELVKYFFLRVKCKII